MADTSRFGVSFAQMWYDRGDAREAVYMPTRSPFWTLVNSYSKDDPTHYWSWQTFDLYAVQVRGGGVPGLKPRVLKWYSCMSHSAIAGSFPDAWHLWVQQSAYLIHRFRQVSHGD